MAQAEEAEVIRRRVLDDWLAVLEQLEEERVLLKKMHEPLPKEFCEKLKITSLEIRVSLKEMPSDQHHQDDATDSGDDSKKTSPLKRLKLVS